VRRARNVSNLLLRRFRMCRWRLCFRLRLSPRGQVRVGCPLDLLGVVVEKFKDDRYVFIADAASLNTLHSMDVAIPLLQIVDGCGKRPSETMALAASCGEPFVRTPDAHWERVHIQASPVTARGPHPAPKQRDQQAEERPPRQAARPCSSFARG